MTSDGRLSDSLQRTPWHLIWVLDVSSTMGENGKIQTLNDAVRVAIPHLREIAATNPAAQLLVRAVAFAREAHWVVPAPTPIETFTWTDLDVDPAGGGGYGLDLREVAAQMRVLETDSRPGYPPLIVAISDCMWQHDVSSIRVGVTELLATPWGEKTPWITVGVDPRVPEVPMDDPELAPEWPYNPEWWRNIHPPWFLPEDLTVRGSEPPRTRLSQPPPPFSAPSSVVW